MKPETPAPEVVPNKHPPSESARVGMRESIHRATVQPREVFREYLPLTALVGIYFLAGQILGRILGAPLQTRPVGLAASSGIVLALILLAGILLLSLACAIVTWAAAWPLSRTGRPTVLADRASHFVRRAVSPNGILRLLIVFALLGVFMNTFVGFKRAIPVIQPFAWDVDFMRLDLLLHGNRHPWEILHPLLSHPAITDVLDTLYYMWFPVHLIALVAIVWGAGRALRNRFLIAFCLVWIVLGTVLAILLSSAGPCYFGRVTTMADPYGPLMAYLQAVDRTHGLIALQIQDILWQGYSQGTTHALIEGISAMPSLHIALPVLYGLATWGIRPAFSIGFMVFAVIMLIGSVHLGWHYAVDGYLSILLVPVVWWAAGRLLTFRDVEPAARP